MFKDLVISGLGFASEVSDALLKALAESSQNLQRPKLRCHGLSQEACCALDAALDNAFRSPALVDPTTFVDFGWSLSNFT